MFNLNLKKCNISKQLYYIIGYGSHIESCTRTKRENVEFLQSFIDHYCKHSVNIC